MMIMETKSGKPLSGNSLPDCGLFFARVFHLSGLFTGMITSLALGMKTVWTLGRFDPEMCRS